jgi:hypothetical protein
MRTKTKKPQLAPAPTTVRGWLLLLKSKIRRRAIVSFEVNGFGDQSADSLADALIRAFPWNCDEFGDKYWVKVCDDARHRPKAVVQPQHLHLFNA